MKKLSHKKDFARRPDRALVLCSLFALLLMVLTGCGPAAPEATVEGVLTLNGTPLDNCLVTFHPETEEGSQGLFAAGITDENGRYSLQRSDQIEGCPIGSHRVTIEDRSVSTGVVRRDHGTVEPDEPASGSRSQVKRSRVPEKYASISDTPLTCEVHSGSQTINLEVK
jgi:hypothetical protein